MMKTTTITFDGQHMNLKGIPLQLNELIPDFRAVTQSMSEVTLADYQGSIKVITSFPSLDTPVCDKQVKMV
jgi:thiol peroxidase